jgi:hypothetical protein
LEGSRTWTTGPRQPLRNILGTSQHRLLIRSNDNGCTTSSVNVVRQRATYQVYCSICRDATNSRDRSATNTPATYTSVTVTAPVMAQKSHSRYHSNTASTSVTVNGNNNFSVFGSNIPALHQSSSINASEGEEDTTYIVNVLYQVSKKISCHEPCLFVA